jgi:hypothetical protein
MAKQTGFLANVLNVPPLIFRFQFNPDLMSDKKSYTYEPIESGRWNLLKDKDAPLIGIEGLIGLDLKSVGPTLINTRQLKPKEGDHRVVSIDFQLDGSPDLPPEVRSRTGSIDPDLAVLRSFMYPSYAITDLPKVLVPTGLAHEPTAPPECNLVYGGTRLTCVMTDLNIKITAFNDDGSPLRAEVSVTLKEQTLAYSPLTEFIGRFIDSSKALTGLSITEAAIASPIGFLFS